MINSVAGQRGAERRADADRAADDPEPEIEPTRAARDVGHDEWKRHTENNGIERGWSRSPSASSFELIDPIPPFRLFGRQGDQELVPNPWRQPPCRCRWRRSGHCVPGERPRRHGPRDPS